MTLKNIKHSAKKKQNQVKPLFPATRTFPRQNQKRTFCRSSAVAWWGVSPKPRQTARACRLRTGTT